MGGSVSKIPQAQLDVYVACTCLSESEILLLLSKYEQLGGSCPATQSAERQYTHKPTPAAQAEVLPSAGEERPKVSMKLIISQKEFANNPFASSLCKIFSTEDPTSSTFGDLSFDEFVDMYSALSPKAKKETKIQTAFRMYDSNGDGYLDPEDLARLLQILTSTGVGDDDCFLTEEQISGMVETLMKACDIDGNGRLSYAEFSKTASRLPEFPSKFCVHLQ